VKKLMRAGVGAEDVDEKVFASCLYTTGIPDPDLIIRTSGEMRLSNFLLWQSAYSEFYFTETLWPDFGRDEFIAAVMEYQGRERRFGALSGKAGK
jgi:undecaprenyl diphosphate synthase